MTDASATAWRHVYRWDLDKTYLDTHFEKLSEVVRIPFEEADDKVNVPGSAALLRELSAEQEDSPEARICIVSGSPRQLRKVLEQKLQADGVRWHEFHLKPQLDNLRRGRFRALREQVGYKLPLLLRSRTTLEPGVQETLFGDDAEADALVYSLYADLVSRRVDEQGMIRVLKKAGAYSDAIDQCRRYLDRIPEAEAVQRIFIHLDRRSPPGWFSGFGSRLVPVFNYFQAALVLFADGHLGVRGVLATTRAFLEADRHPPEELANLFQDVARRGFLPAEAMELLGRAIHEESDVPGEAEVVRRCVQAFGDLSGRASYQPPAPPDRPDYAALLKEMHKRSA